jgi:protein-L-isoaspartate O-methyltransferase
VATVDSLVSTIEKLIGPLPPELRAAYLAVDSERFVRPCDRDFAYENWPLPLETPSSVPCPPVADLLAEYGSWQAALFDPRFRGAGATISAPVMYALAFRMLGLREGHRLLELGTGTGYGASLAAHVTGPGGRVTSVDVDPHLVAVARELTGDLATVQILHDDGRTRADLLATCDRAWLTFGVLERSSRASPKEQRFSRRWGRRRPLPSGGSCFAARAA